MRHLKLVLLAAFLILGLGRSTAPALAQDTPAPAAATEQNVTASTSNEAAAATEEEATPASTSEADTPETSATSSELGNSAEVLSDFQLVIQAMKDGKWGLAAAGVLMLLVWALRTFLWASLPKEYLPYITVGISGVVAFATAVIAGTDLLSSFWVALGGLLAGLAGVGFWELLGKKILPKAEAS